MTDFRLVPAAKYDDFGERFGKYLFQERIRFMWIFYTWETVERTDEYTQAELHRLIHIRMKERLRGEQHKTERNYRKTLPPLKAYGKYRLNAETDELLVDVYPMRDRL